MGTEFTISPRCEQAPENLYTQGKKGKPDADGGPGGMGLGLGVRWLRKGTFLKLHKMPLTGDQLVVIVAVVY